eukprot:9945704-Heterocapsa_arctica.AAC.1
MDDDMLYNKYNNIKKDYTKYITEGHIIKDGLLIYAGDNGGGISALIALILYLQMFLNKKAKQ